MSEHDQKPRQDVPDAQQRRSWWGGWIWGVPIAALAIVGYLAVKELSQQGPSVTVTFDEAGGVRADQTKVEYQGLQVGAVTSVTLQKDLQHVDVVLQLHSDMEGHLGPGTRFWIAGQSPSLSNLSSIKSVISGPHIGIDPRPGDKQDHYNGLSRPPAVKETEPGTHYTLLADKLGSVTRGSTIYYHDLPVGTVQHVELDPKTHRFSITAFVRQPFDQLVHGNTRFWNSGAVQVAMTGSGPRLQVQSLPALFSGAVSFTTPDIAADQPVATDGARFTLYQDRDTARYAPGASAVRYQVVFPAKDAADLQEGAPVQLVNRQVGSVLHSTLLYDTSTHALALAASIVIDPGTIHLGKGQSWGDDPRQQMNALLSSLIDQGLRARLGKTVPFVGSAAVVLDFVPHAESAALGSGKQPLIPTAPPSGVDNLVASLSSFGAKLDAVPIDRIGEDIRKTTDKLAQLSQSPELQSSLQHLHDTLANVDHVSEAARGQIGPLLAQLRRTASAADSTVQAARSLIASNGLVRNQPGTTGIANALYELSRAARALRQLANYLDRHPEALLQGRG